MSHCVVYLAMKIAAILGAGLPDQRATTGKLIMGVRKIRNWSGGPIP